MTCKYQETTHCHFFLLTCLFCLKAWVVELNLAMSIQTRFIRCPLCQCSDWILIFLSFRVLLWKVRSPKPSWTASSPVTDSWCGTRLRPSGSTKKQLKVGCLPGLQFSKKPDHFHFVLLPTTTAIIEGDHKLQSFSYKAGGCCQICTSLTYILYIYNRWNCLVFKHCLLYALST